MGDFSAVEMRRSGCVLFWTTLWGLRAKSKTRNATLTSQSGVLSQQPRSMVLEQRSSSLNPTLHNTEQRLPNKTPLCNLHSERTLAQKNTDQTRSSGVKSVQHRST